MRVGTGTGRTRMERRAGDPRERSRPPKNVPPSSERMAARCAEPCCPGARVKARVPDAEMRGRTVKSWASPPTTERLKKRRCASSPSSPAETLTAKRGRTLAPEFSTTTVSPSARANDGGAFTLTSSTTSVLTTDVSAPSSSTPPSSCSTTSSVACPVAPGAPAIVSTPSASSVGASANKPGFETERMVNVTSWRTSSSGDPRDMLPATATDARVAWERGEEGRVVWGAETAKEGCWFTGRTEISITRSASSSSPAKAVPPESESSNVTRTLPLTLGPVVKKRVPSSASSGTPPAAKKSDTA
mmetsp:Transcript_50609/g.120522  ORF Transcript_50609/g.120522 Transcript_50609/m.120522 type:complete len:302 (-) Transcript_50609:223-1128(-)